MVQMIPDPNGRVRSREVGCQWESPEPEERRDVGCQSYLTMRRDAGVQTDLSWRPSGNCFAPQKKRQSERSEFSREKPRGLTLTNHGVQRAQKRKRTWKEEEEEQREEVCGLNFTSGEDLHVHLSVHGNEGSRHGDSKGAENTQSPGRKPAGPLIRSPLESEEQLHDLAAANQDRGRKLHRESGDRGGASGETAKISSERQMDHVVSDRHLLSDELTEGQQRPKRKMVGPPVRYLVESEKQLRGPTAANRDWGNKPQKKSACRVLSSKVGTDPDKPIGHVVSSGLASHVMSDGHVSNGHLVSDGHVRHMVSDGQTRHTVLDSQMDHVVSDELQRPRRKMVCGLNFTSGEDLHVHLSVHGNEGSRHGDSKEAENTQSPGRKPAGPLIRSPLESEEQLHDLAAANQDRGRKLHRESGDRGGASGDTAKISSERQMDHVVSDRHLVSDELTEGQQRPKRKMVGPPVRYLVESEKQLRGPTAANRDWGNKPQKKSACRVLSSKVGTDPDKPIGHVVSSGLASHVMSDGLVVSNGHLVSDGLTSHVMSDGDLGHVVLDRLTSHEMSDGHMVSDEHTGCTLLSGHGVLDGQMGHMVSDKWQRPRRKMVGPPIRYLLESEELSCDPPTVNKNCRRKLQKGTVRSGVSSVRATTDLDKQSHVVLDGLIGHVDSYDQLGHVVSEQHRVSDVNIVLDGEMGHVASDEHRRPRRKTVGPPIRYLLESEEQSHGPAVANQDRWRGFKQGGKPQDTAGLAGDLSDTTMIDLEKKTRCHKMSATHMDSVRFVDLDGLTSHVVSEQQRLRRMMVVPPTRYLIESEEQSHGLVAASRNCGMKPQKSSRYLSSSSGDTEKQMGDIASDNLLGHLQAYLVYRDLQSNQVTIIPPCFVRLQHLL